MSYQRRKVVKVLAKHGFTVLREGIAHTIVGIENGPRQPVPRHKELDRRTVRGIVNDLGLDWQNIEKESS